MSNANASRIPKDIAKVELTEEWELAYWTQHFNTNEQDLRAALQEAGNATEQVKRHLESRQQG
ncbi:Protein of unknown function [Pseudoxanthomonas sp. GM95]|uniref:DUF3606 domain-containing protein n=1 Tax=Pseudoxanthomonas sp. GM95 TaxID=1881043 RepID=UPI0008AE113F|nr:DUF3606 domain-containing protein [Pseudoxanthomonas sp. GM95]SEK76134.1 Protein of unknown function [Pseudoxanthomonas sp. GM95]